MSPTPSLKLWRFLMIVLSVVMMGGVSLNSGGMAGPTTSDPGIVGADFSSLLQHEASGKEFLDGGVAAPLEDILSANGVNYARIRLWVDSKSSTGDLDAALLLASRSADAGMKILLDIHYSDTWADADNQKLPAAWADLDRNELIETVRVYTESVVGAFDAQGTPVAMVQIGNEIRNGMLWDWGKLHWPWGEHWAGFAELYRAGAEGALAATPDAPPRIVLHTNPPFTEANTGAHVHFFDNVVKHGMPFDVIGLSYYPFWAGSFMELSQSVNYLAQRYDKDILIVETGYPWTLDDTDSCANAVRIAEDLPDRWRHPPTPEGQASYYNELRAVLERVPAGHGLGFFAWEPAWMPDVSLSDIQCNEYAGLTLFDWRGNALPALGELAK